MDTLAISIGVVTILLSGVSFYMMYQLNKQIHNKQVKQDKALAKMLAKQESFIFMTQKQYEKEYHLFWNLFDLLTKTTDKIKSIKGSLQLLKENTEISLEETYVKLIQDGLMKSGESINELDNHLNQYEPFIQEELFNEFKQMVYDLQSFQHRRFNYFSYETVNNETINDFLKDISETVDKSENIRENVVVYLRKYFENSRVN